MKNTLKVVASFGFIAIAAAGCSKKNNTPAPTQNPITSAISAAKQELQSLAPSAPSEASSLNWMSKLNPLSAATFGTQLTGLGWPGGFCDNLTEAENVSPRQYLAAVLDPEFTCGSDGDENVPTVFGRFDQDVFALELISDRLPFSNGRIVAGEYTFEAEIPGMGPVEITTIATDLSNSEFDTNLAVTSEFFENTILFKNREGIINIFGLEDAREDVGNEALRWGHLKFDTTNGYISYEWFSLQQGGANLELQRALRPADTEQAYFLHIFGVDGRLNQIAVYAPEGTESEDFSVSMALQYDGGASDYDFASACVTSAYSATDGFCASHGSNPIGIGNVGALPVWADANAIYDTYVTPSSNIRNRVPGFTNRTEFLTVYPVD